MILAGFDVASSTGICVMNDDNVVHTEIWYSRMKRPEGLGSQEIDIEYEAALGEEFRAHVYPLITAHGVEAVGYEEPRTRDYERTKTIVDPAAQWAGAGVRHETQRSSSNLAMVRALILCAHLIGICKKKNIPIYGIPADTWRKSILGYSRAPKGTKDGRKYLKQAVRRQCHLLGIDVQSDDVGDSVGVAFHLRGMFNPALAGRVNDLFAKRAS